MSVSEVKRRARTLEEFDTLGENFRTEAGFQAGLAFKPRPTDLLISPFAKSGTTWLQHIAHGLRTRGSMDFEEISLVVPWIEQAYDLGADLGAEQEAAPRLFKSHLSWYDVPKGGRYVCSIRHPEAAAVSHYRFMEGWWFEPGSISLDDFTRHEVLKDPEERGYWRHLISWWEQRENPDVLLLCYEDMKTDLPSTVRAVARHMGIELDGDLLEIVVRQSTREFMLAHKSHFDEHPTREYFARRGGAPIDGDSSKITPGASDERRYTLSAEIKGEFDALWHRMIYQRLGLADYAALQEAIAALPRR